MRIAEYYILVVFCLFFCGNAKAQTATDDSPKIRFEAKRIDFGDVLFKKDSVYVYRFVYENVGSAPLIVNQVIGHCPCVYVTHSTDPLPPGGRDTVSVYFKPTHASKYSQQVSVFSNSAISVISLYAKGNFLKPSDPKLTAKPNQDE